MAVEPADRRRARRAPAEVAGPTLWCRAGRLGVPGVRAPPALPRAVAHALEWHRHLRGAQDPDAALRGGPARAVRRVRPRRGAGRLAAANAREHELAAGPRRPKTKKGLLRGRRARGRRVARRAARSARAVAALEDRLNAVLLDERGEPRAL